MRQLSNGTNYLDAAGRCGHHHSVRFAACHHLARAKGANPRAEVSGNLVPYSVLSRLGSALNTNRYAMQSGYYKSRAGGMGASVALLKYLAKFTDLVLLRPAGPDHWRESAIGSARCLHRIEVSGYWPPHAVRFHLSL
jgi:hypothetical protein